MSRATCVLACLALLAACSEGTDVESVETADAPAASTEPLAREAARAEPLAREAAPPGGEAAPPANAPTTPGGPPPGGAPPAGAAECNGLAWDKYLPDPSWPSEEAGLSKTDHHSDVVLADVNGDDQEDLVVSSGNDKTPEVVEAFYNTGVTPVLADLRSRYSAQEAYYGKVAVGNVDDDPCNEIVAAVFFDNQGKKMNGGDIFLFDSNDGTGSCEFDLVPIPIESGINRFTAPSLTLGDVDGDADLDVIVAVATRFPGKFPPPNLGNVKHGDHSRIYLNDGKDSSGKIQFNHVQAWKDAPNKKARASDVEFADVDGDGYGDLVFATRSHPTVFWGEEPAGANHQTGITKSGCRPPLDMAKYEFDVSFSVDVARVKIGGATKGFVAHVSADAQGKTKNYQPVFREFQVFEATRAGNCFDTTPWKSASKGRGSLVRFGDLLGDGTIYLLGGRWSDDEDDPAAGSLLRVYEGDTSSGSLTFSLKTCLGDAASEPVVNGLALADLGDTDLVQEVTPEITIPAQARLVTLDRQLVETIERVQYETGGVWLDLDPSQYAWVPGENWVSFHKDAAGKKVKIHFRTSKHWDLAYGDWRANAWPRIHYRKN